MDKKKSTGLLLSILGVLSLVLITAGVTYAFFTYAKEGQTPNTLTTGTIEFLYTENKPGTGTGIDISNAFPMTNADGMADATNPDKFQFTITSKTPTTSAISYTVTARKASTSTLSENQIKIWLDPSADNAATGNITASADNKIATPALYSSLTQYNKVPAATAVEKVIYTATIPQSETTGATRNYEKTFTFKMWVDGGDGGASNTAIDYSAFEFIAKSAVTAAGNNPITIVDTANNINLMTTGTKGVDKKFLISTDYYSLPTTVTEGDFNDRSDFVRITHYKKDANGVVTIYAVGQTPASTEGYTASEQYYPLSGGTFGITINVYAENAAVVTLPLS